MRTKKICGHQLVEDGSEYLKIAAVRAYSAKKSSSIDDEQITELLPMVQRIVQRVITYLKPPLSYEDLVSAGAVGLVKAARDFDASREVEFKTYAYIRIRGAILDELRSWSFVPTNTSRQIHEALEFSRKITEQTGRAPTNAQLAQKLHVSVDKLYQTFENARAQHFLSIDSSGEDTPALCEFLSAANAVGPDEKLEKAELVNKLAEAIQQLSKKKRQIILLYYQQHLTMKQIAEIFKITESRVSQLHASALFDLSVKLREWKNDRR